MRKCKEKTTSTCQREKYSCCKDRASMYWPFGQLDLSGRRRRSPLTKNEGQGIFFIREVHDMGVPPMDARARYRQKKVKWMVNANQECWDHDLWTGKPQLKDKEEKKRYGYELVGLVFCVGQEKTNSISHRGGSSKQWKPYSLPYR